MFDEAKAFCPGCGKAFVEEEKRERKSEFEQQDSTVELGKTMYNQMLADMGLDLSKKPKPAEKRVEVIAPVGSPAKAKATAKAEKPSVTEKSAAPVPAPAAPITLRPSEPTGGRAKWIVLSILGFLLLFPPAAIATAGIIYDILLRLR
jgi:hypothetical protein